MIEALVVRLARARRLALHALLLRLVVGLYPPYPTHQLVLAQLQTFDVVACVPGPLPLTFYRFGAHPLEVRSGPGGAFVSRDDGGSC